MISLTTILADYPQNLRAHQESILKEYLQVKILNSIFNSPYNEKLVFLGGTALRIVYESTRFSEDLDFDNFNLNDEEFIHLGKIIEADLRLEGLEVEIQTITKKVYRLKIRIPKLLFENGLSGYINQKILIQVDTTPQHFEYQPEKMILNRFEIFTQINTVPKDLLLAQKICASIGRKRIMGRDFFDIVFLYGIGATPNMEYLHQKIGVQNVTELKKYYLEKIDKLDFAALAKDVESILFDPRDIKKIILFPEFIKQKWGE